MQLFPLTNDFVFKSLFVQAPDLLASFMSSVLYPNGEHKIHKIEIKNPELPKDFKDDKKSYLDIKAEDDDGRIFQVEVQVAHQSSFIKRCLFYLAGLIREQLKPGDPYSKIRAVCQINILDFELIPVYHYHSRFKLRNEFEPNVTLTDQLEIHFLELPKVPENSGEGNLRNGNDLYRWLYFLKNAHQMEESEMEIVVDKTPDLRKAYGILEKYSSDPKKRRQIEEKIKADRDYAYDLAGSFEAGEKRGLEMGEKKKALEDARRMKEEGISEDVISRVTGLTIKDLSDHGIV